MAQRKPPAGKTPAAKRPSGSGSARSAAKTANRPAGKTAAKTASSARPAGAGRPPARKSGKSIVNQKQRPWGLIAAAVAVVLFAAAIIVVVIATKKDSSGDSATKGGQSVSSKDPYRQPALAAAMAINGVAYRVEGEHTHVEGTIGYDRTPPIGGNHSQYWADCTGTVYPKAIANENAVHMLEHGAIWITYNPSKLSSSGVATLSKLVSGQDRMAMSPYPNLKTAISLQAWGYQLFVNSPTDSRIAQFIKVLRYNKQTTPEYGASCSQPTFKTHPSTFGHPLWVPAGS